MKHTAKLLLSLLCSAMMWPQHMPAQEKSLTVPDNSQYILTPPAPATPRINSARVFGVRPKAEFRYTIAATGDRPMTFSAEGLPKGLKLDAQTGIITGRLKKKGTYKVLLRAKNNLGEAERDLRIEVGEDGVSHVVAAVDADADQSALLAGLPQELLAKLVLPLGEFTKADAAEIASAKAE